MKGWFALHRKVFDCDLFTGEKYSHREAWIYLISRAAQNEKTILVDGKPLKLNAGEFHTSIEKLASVWGWNRKTVARYLTLFEEEGMLTQTRTRKGTTIKLTNYAIYDIKNVDGWTTEWTTERTSEWTTERTSERTQTKSIKSKKEKNNNITSDKSDELDLAFEKIYYAYPKKVGKTKAKQIYKALLTKGRKIDGKTVKFTHEDICAGLNVYYNDKTEPNNGEIGDTKYWMNFDTLMNRIQDYVERREELDE